MESHLIYVPFLQHENIKYLVNKSLWYTAQIITAFQCAIQHHDAISDHGWKVDSLKSSLKVLQYVNYSLLGLWDMYSCSNVSCLDLTFFTKLGYLRLFFHLTSSVYVHRWSNFVYHANQWIFIILFFHNNIIANSFSW